MRVLPCSRKLASGSFDSRPWDEIHLLYCILPAHSETTCSSVRTALCRPVPQSASWCLGRRVMPLLKLN